MTAGKPEPSAEDLLRRLPASPDAYAQKIDFNSGRVLLIVFDEAGYRAASFLDDRILGPATQGAWFPLGQVALASRQVSLACPLHFIFHTGHVGSTLVSRLLDYTGTVLSLREPLPLRSLADAHDCLGRPDSLLSEADFDHALALFLRLWSRGYAATQSVVVKATSSAARLAMPILSASEGTRAIYMNLRPEAYLATLLAGANSPTDLRGHGPERMRRLSRHFAAPLPPLHALSIGELAAMSWLAESWTQHEAQSRGAGRILAIDFDAFLAGIVEGMARILGHFGLPADAGFLSAVEHSPVLTRYSKAPEHAYTPQLRADVLRDSRRDNRGEIRKGLDWLERRARSEPAVGRLVQGAGV